MAWKFHASALYPFPWRSAKGSVYFPRAGEAWVWAPEVAAARAAGFRFDVLESWTWRGRCRHGAARWIDDVYSERLRAKSRGDGAEHALKLGLNSLYGKLAQRVGAQYDDRTDTWRLPPYHDLAGAGWITSSVRAQLFRAAMQAPAHVVMLATDGIYTTRPLALPISPADAKRLGEWDYQTHTSATIVQSGVYYLGRGEEESLYTRGFDAESVSRADILDGWRRRAPHIVANQERFIGLGRALASAAQFRTWRTWLREPRDLALYPWLTKRTPVLARGARTPGDASRALLPTIATDTTRYWHDPLSAHGAMTTPSPVPWRTFADLDVEEMDRVSRDADESEDARL